MDNVKIGEFIKTLRRELGYSQQDLADLIPISREGVSKWERGVNLPDSSSLLRLSEIFNVSINELLYGERKTKKNKNDISNITVELYEKNNKKSKRLKILLSALIITIILFLTYYFINTFNTLKVYNINYSDNSITIKNGMLVTTKEKIYLKLGDIMTDNNIEFLRLYFKNKNGEENLILETDYKEIELVEFLGYNNYFDFKDLNQILKETYLEIVFEDESKTIHIEYDKDFANDYLVPKKETSITKDKLGISINSEELENKITNKFKLKDNLYTFQAKNLKFLYVKDLNLIILTQKNKDNKKVWNYNLLFQSCEFQEYNESETINSFIFNNDGIECRIEDCNKNENEIKFFFEKLSNILK